MLWHDLCSSECSLKEIIGQGGIWSSSPILRDNVNQDLITELNGCLPELNYLDPTKVVIDSPESKFNKPVNVLNEPLCHFPAQNMELPVVFQGPNHREGMEYLHFIPHQ